MTKGEFQARERELQRMAVNSSVPDERFEAELRLFERIEYDARELQAAVGRIRMTAEGRDPRHIHG